MSRSLSRHRIHKDTQLVRTTLVLQRLERKIPHEMLQPQRRRVLKFNRASSAKLANQIACSDKHSNSLPNTFCCLSTQRLTGSTAESLLSPKEQNADLYSL